MKENEIESALNAISSRLQAINAPPNLIIISNKELQDELGVCKRTLQKWRDNGYIGFSKIGREIFYRMSDVITMLDRFYNAPIAA